MAIVDLRKVVAEIQILIVELRPCRQSPTMESRQSERHSDIGSNTGIALHGLGKPNGPKAQHISAIESVIL